jgi:hypothetical protein
MTKLSKPSMLIKPTLDTKFSVDYDWWERSSEDLSQLDELNLAIRMAAADPNFINPQTSLVDSVFRVFLANGNVPQTPKELAEKTGRNPSTILKTFSGVRIYKGVRPHNDE